MRRALPGLVGHALVVLFLFWGPLLEGRVLYFRDISVTYYPDYVFVAGWLARGVLPLWNHAVDGGTPFLMAYPVDLALLAGLGARATLAVSPPLHVLAMMLGTSALAVRLGAGAPGAWLAGTAFGASGLALSSVLYPDFLAAAWLPWVLVAAREVVERPAAGRIARLAVFATLQLSTFGAAVVLQTACLALVLAWPGRRWRAWAALAAAAVVAALAAAPAWLGALALLRGSARGVGFGAQAAFAYSLRLPLLIETAWPRFFGDVHAFSDHGFIGQPFHPGGNPYYVSLYLGLGTLALALRSRSRRLWGVAVVALMAALGANGPLATPLEPIVATLRAPIKFLFSVQLALCLLAGLGLRALPRRRAAFALALLPGALLGALALAASARPGALLAALHALVPQIPIERAGVVAAGMWPGALATSAALLAAAGLALSRGGRFVSVAAAALAVDLLVVNVGVNPAADGRFYELRADVERLLDSGPRDGSRVYSYGVAHSPPLDWAPAIAQRNDDVWLYYLDRQSLLPRLHVLDGLESAYDLDRMGWARPGATLDVGEASPLRFAGHYDRFRLGNVRWVMSFAPLPEALAVERAAAQLPEVRQPLRLYEVRGALPRAFHVARFDLRDAPPGRGVDATAVVSLDREPPPLDGWPTAGGRVRYQRVDPHTVRLRCSGPPGYVVVVDHHAPGWTLTDASGAPVPLLRANGRHWGFATPGGEATYTARYRPLWLTPALALAAAGWGAVLLLWFRRVGWAGRPAA